MPPKRVLRRGTQRNPEPSVGSTTQGQLEVATGGSRVEFAKDFLNMLQGFMQQQQATPQNVPNSPPIMPHTNEVVEQFRHFTPPRFKGNEGPIAIEE